MSRMGGEYNESEVRIGNAFRIRSIFSEKD